MAYIDHSQFNPPKLVLRSFAAKEMTDFTYQSAYIDHSQFDPSKLVLRSFVAKEMPDFTYHSTSVMYEYESKDGNKVIAPLRIQGPDLHSPDGPKLKMRDERLNALLYTTFDLNNPEVSSFVSLNGFWQKLYAALADHVWNTKNVLKLNIKKKSDINGIFPFPITLRRDDNGNIIPNKGPSKYFNLFTGKEQHTVFYAPIEDVLYKYIELGWDVLQDVTMTFKPTIVFPALIVADGKIFLKSSIKSAIVSDFTKNPARNMFGEIILSAVVKNGWMSPPPYCSDVPNVVVEFSEPPPYSEGGYVKTILDQELPPPSYE